MKQNNKTVLLFDLDGTLLDSAPDLAKAVNHMLVTLNLKEFSQEVIRGWVGNGARTLVERALKHSIKHNVLNKTFSEAEILSLIHI